MNKLSAADMRRILTHLDAIKELTDRLRREHFDVPYALVADAVAGEMLIRKALYEAAVGEIELETMQPIGAVVARVVGATDG